jgi:hypothetical protein
MRTRVGPEDCPGKSKLKLRQMVTKCCIWPFFTLIMRSIFNIGSIGIKLHYSPERYKNKKWVLVTQTSNLRMTDEEDETEFPYAIQEDCGPNHPPQALNLSIPSSKPYGRL